MNVKVLDVEILYEACIERVDVRRERAYIKIDRDNMSESVKKMTSIQLFNSSSNIEFWLQRPLTTGESGGTYLAPSFQEDLDTEQRQTVVSCLESNSLGGAYLTKSSEGSASSSLALSMTAPTKPAEIEDLSMFETITELDTTVDLKTEGPQIDSKGQTESQGKRGEQSQTLLTSPHAPDESSWEAWFAYTKISVPQQAISRAGKQVDAGDEAHDDNIIFKLREQRAQQWNQILDPRDQFEPLRAAESVPVNTPEMSLEDTLTLSGEHESISGFQEELKRALEGDLDEADKALPTKKSLSYLTRYAPIKGHPIQAKELFKTASPNEQASRSSESDPTNVETHSPTRTIACSKVREVLDPFLPLLKLIERLHNEGLCLGGFDPSLFYEVSESSGEAPSRVRPIYPLRLYQSSAEAELLIESDNPAQRSEPSLHIADFPFVKGEEVSVYLGYSPPEMYGYYRGVPSPRSDVFSAAMLIYYAITGCPRFAETMRPFARLPSPVVYRQDLPPELVSVIYRAISPSPHRRQAHLTELLDDLEWALSTAELREQVSPVSLSLEAGHEIHIGLLKGQYNPINQDDLFLGYQADSDLGLFVVTDGVSICEHGSGDLASGLVREESAQAWRDLCRSTQPGDEEETLSELNLNAFEGQTYNYGKVLTSIINGANRRIGDYINQRVPVFHGPPEGIMAATIVAAAISRGVAMFTSVGDSRIYLIRDGRISGLMYDEDLYTHLLQARQTPSQAQQSPSAAALVHCVGEFSKNNEQHLIPNQISPQLREIKLLPGDQLVLCSDGIPDYAGVDEEDAEAKILRSVEEALSVHHAAFELITLANRGGGGDNLSCIVLKFGESLEFMRGE